MYIYICIYIYIFVYIYIFMYIIGLVREKYSSILHKTVRHYSTGINSRMKVLGVN